MPRSINDTRTALVSNETSISTFIAADANLSNSIYSGGNTFLGLYLNKTFTVGNLYFLSALQDVVTDYNQICNADCTFYTISSANLSAALGAIQPDAAGIHIPLDPSIFSGAQWIKIYCDVVQVSTQQIRLLMAPILG